MVRETTLLPNWAVNLARDSPPAALSSPIFTKGHRSDENDRSHVKIFGLPALGPQFTSRLLVRQGLALTTVNTSLEQKDFTYSASEPSGFGETPRYIY